MQQPNARPGARFEAVTAILVALLLVGHFFHVPVLFKVAMVVGLLALLVPFVAKWLAKGWFGLSEVLGYVNSRILLGAVFLVLLTPIGWVSRLFGHDPLMLKKKGKNSWFVERNHLYEPKDLKEMF